jgi:hypothetical protein
MSKPKAASARPRIKRPLRKGPNWQTATLLLMLPLMMMVLLLLLLLLLPLMMMQNRAPSRWERQAPCIKSTIERSSKCQWWLLLMARF